MKEKGFYLLQPEKVKYFEGLLEAIKALNEGGIWLCFPTKETNKEGEMYLTSFTMWFDTIEKEGKFYVRMRMSRKNKGVVSEKLILSSKKAPKEFFNRIRNYLDQKLKKEKLSELFLPIQILENQKEELAVTFIKLKKTRDKKIQAIRSQNFAEAAEFRDEEKNLIGKLLLVIKEKVKTKRGFGWVTDDHILDIIKELN